ncbi:hypothetical protein OIU77_029808 [Salix suchowensis]|uniref:Uncharacterized protein n=1 Tax=Salix suchowensis TaxID=1278906 RepID=A0ABQ9BBP6_9ROSI|nr:hypothetical protein OIU77_029808 [Salix suchowensis]
MMTKLFFLVSITLQLISFPLNQKTRNPQPPSRPSSQTTASQSGSSLPP